MFGTFLFEIKILLYKFLEHLPYITIMHAALFPFMFGSCFFTS